MDSCSTSPPVQGIWTGFWMALCWLSEISQRSPRHLKRLHGWSVWWEPWDTSFATVSWLTLGKHTKSLTCLKFTGKKCLGVRFDFSSPKKSLGAKSLNPRVFWAERKLASCSPHLAVKFLVDYCKSAKSQRCCAEFRIWFLGFLTKKMAIPSFKVKTIS